MEIARIVLSVILSLMLLVSGGGKVANLPFSRTNRDAIGVNPAFWRFTGGLELAAVVGLVWGIWFVPFGLAAAIGLAMLMLGAMVFRLRSRDRAVIAQGLADIAVFVLALVVIALNVIDLVR
jgi:hypothetical protein